MKTLDSFEQILNRIRHRLYRECGSFTHDGCTYDLDSALASAVDIPPIKVRDAAWVLQHTDVQPERERNADITDPVLVTTDSEGRLPVVDGAHRLSRAIRDGVDTLPAREVVSFVPANAQSDSQSPDQKS